MMGGLRLGEVVNLTHDAVEVFEDENYMSLSIDDRQKQLFLYRGINTEYSQVKKLERTSQYLILMVSYLSTGKVIWNF